MVMLYYTEQHFIISFVLYLEKEVRGVLLQVGIHEGFYRLQQAAETEAHEEWVVCFPLCHYG